MLNLQLHLSTSMWNMEMGRLDVENEHKTLCSFKILDHFVDLIIHP